MTYSNPQFADVVVSWIGRTEMVGFFILILFKR